MKLSFYLLFMIFFFIGCAKDDIPKRDISNAKMALAQSDNSIVKEYAPQKLKKLKTKYKELDRLINQKKYEEAKFLAQDIQIQSLLIQKEASINKLSKKIKNKEDVLKNNKIDLEEKE